MVKASEARKNCDYYKPPPGVQTAHLLVGNVPGASAEAIAAVLGQFGKVTRVQRREGRESHVFVSFEEEGVAAAARASLAGRPCAVLGGRPLVVEHAGLRRRKLAPDDWMCRVVPAHTEAGECGVPGLLLARDFVGEAEEAALLAAADAAPWEPLAHRRVQHYGAAFDYECRRLGGARAPIPAGMRAVAARVEALPGALPFDQLTVNEYPCGVGIAPHADCHSAFGGAVALVSLASPAALLLRRENLEPRALLLPRRSALLLSGEARFAWEHYIPNRKCDPLVTGEVVPRAPRRVSLTFRQQLEDQHVNAVYDAIAPHFSATRFAVWPKVREFVDSLAPGAVVADVGCGNGKYFGLRRDLFVLGTDRSTGLAGLAARRLAPDPKRLPLLADVAVADALVLPLRPCSCDAVLCIAVLHHLSSAERRLRLLAQLLRALRPGGRALVTVWATQQEDMRKVRRWRRLGAVAAAAAAGSAMQDPLGGLPNSSSSSESDRRGDERQAEQREAELGEDAPVASGDYFVPWHLPFHRAEAAAAATAAARAPAGAVGTSAGAARVNASKGAVVLQRYYHLFEAGELEGLVGRLPGADLAAAFYDRDNHCVVILRRPQEGAA
eukprot:scaffold21.g2138.t1